MAGFERDNQGCAHLAGANVDALLVEHQIRLPAFLYDVGAITETASKLVAALGPADVVCYAVKANSAGTILRSMAAVNTGADVVSGAELELALRSGIAPNKLVMSGVAKSNDEIDLAISRGILAIQAESVEEIERIAARADAVGETAQVGIRINPGIRIDSHAHVATGHEDAKFGIVRAALPRAWELLDAHPRLQAVGVSTHLGSTLSKTDDYLAGGRVVCDVAAARRAAGRPLTYINFGGGFGIDYGKGAVPAPWEFAQAAFELRKQLSLEDHRLLIEPGRSVVGSFGVLVADVLQVKTHGGARWLLINAGMNDLLRPALYQAHHRIEPTSQAPNGEPWRVAGPVCESTDDFGTHVVSDPAPARVVIRDAGAYGFVMASEYNGRALPTEVFINDGKVVHVSASPGSARWVQSRVDA